MKPILIALMFLLPAKRVPDGRWYILEINGGTLEIISTPLVPGSFWGEKKNNCKCMVDYWVMQIQSGNIRTWEGNPVIRITCRSGNHTHIWKIIVPAKK